MNTVALVLGTGLFAGYSPIAPGTAGSFAVVVLYGLVPGLFAWKWIWTVWIGLFVVGVWAAGRCETFWGKDPGKVVIDEVVGMMIAIGFMPLNWKIVIAGFFFFRFFDIFKPPPARRLEKIHGGFGVMADDVIAALYANIVLRVLVLLVPWMIL